MQNIPITKAANMGDGMIITWVQCVVFELPKMLAELYNTHWHTKCETRLIPNNTVKKKSRFWTFSDFFFPEKCSKKETGGG